jgi:hypothetical protein
MNDWDDPERDQAADDQPITASRLRAPSRVLPVAGLAGPMGLGLSLQLRDVRR